MYNHHHSGRNQSSALCASAVQCAEKSGGACFVDNRNAETVQLKSTAKFSGQNYKFNNTSNKTQLVGKKMEAWLDPAKPMKGQESSVNTSQNGMMSAIRAAYGIKSVNVVKGHLLNANLGGPALSYNLYPITKGANGTHLSYVENVAKTELWHNNQGIYYKVDVDGTPNITSPTASFDCEIFKWNPSTQKMGEQILGVSVKSDLNSVGTRKATNTLDPKAEATSVADPGQPARIPEPSTKVGDLTPAEKTERLEDINKTLASSGQRSK